MKKIIIAGGGGFAYEVSEYLRQDIAAGLLVDVIVDGYLDDREDISLHEPLSIPYLGSILEYKPQNEEYVVIAIGSPSGKKKVYRQLKSVGCSFFSYAHSSAYVSSSAKIGEGVFVCPFCVVNSGAVIEDFAMLNVFCSIGHGAVVGEFSVLSPYSALNGDASVGCGCFLGTRATVFPRTHVGNDCIIDTHSFVRMDAGDKSMITNRSKYMVLNNRLIKGSD
jgi:sugar O-acyltransferase (sialic acid O-acetyltransferase NeuD family)